MPQNKKLGVPILWDGDVPFAASVYKETDLCQNVAYIHWWSENCVSATGLPRMRSDWDKHWKESSAVFLGHLQVNVASLLLSHYKFTAACTGLADKISWLSVADIFFFLLSGVAVRPGRLFYLFALLLLSLANCLSVAVAWQFPHYFSIFYVSPALSFLFVSACSALGRATQSMSLCIDKVEWRAHAEHR